MDPSYDAALVRYGELSLKGPAVRKEFESKLATNISERLRASGIHHELGKARGRIVVETPEAEGACSAISKVFGVVSASPVIRVRSDMEAIKGAALRLADGRIGPESTFAVETNRGNKAFRPNSQEVEAAVGEFLRLRTGGKVDLGNPTVTIGIDIREETYLFTHVVRGPGGLPLGTAGRVLSLFSGGIDSPVATYLMMKRGCETTLLHFDNTPFTGTDTRERAIEVAKGLNDYASGSEMRLLVAPHGHNLSSFIEKCPRKLTCILCKRMMFRIGEDVAKLEGCSAVVNGSSLAQVCSQTMANLALTLSVCSVPVLMPLIGFDKDETIQVSREIGTYVPSSTKVTACSAVPRHPRTQPTEEEILKAESKVDVSDLVRRSVDGLSEITLS